MPEPPRGRDRELAGPGAQVRDQRIAVEPAVRERRDILLRVGVPLFPVETGDEVRVKMLGTGVRQLVEQPALGTLP